LLRPFCRAGVIFFSGVSWLQAQAPAPATPPPAQQPADKEADKQKDEDENPFAPEPAPALLLGMKGSDANDRAPSLRRAFMTRAKHRWA